MKIVICGAGRGGLSLAIHLQSLGHVVTIIERDGAIAARASEEHGLVALVGDATEVRTLRQTEPERADVLLAMLHRDADNLAVALLARANGAKRVMVRMRDSEYRAVYEGAGVHQILSETEVVVGALTTAIEHPAVRHSMVVGKGTSIAFEIVLPDRGAIIGKSVSEVALDHDFPRSCVIAGMTLDDQIQTPRGASILEAGTQLLIVVAQHELTAAIDFFLRA